MVGWFWRLVVDWWSVDRFRCMLVSRWTVACFRCMVEGRWTVVSFRCMVGRCFKMWCIWNVLWHWVVSAEISTAYFGNRWCA